MKLFLGILTVYQKKAKVYFLECKTIQYPNKVKFIIKNDHISKEEKTIQREAKMSQNSLKSGTHDSIITQNILK